MKNSFSNLLGPTTLEIKSLSSSKRKRPRAQGSGSVWICSQTGADRPCVQARPHLSDPVWVCYPYSSGWNKITVPIWISSIQVPWGRKDPIQNWSRCKKRLVFIIKYKGFLYAVGSLFSHPHYLDPYQWRLHGTCMDRI